MACNCDNCPICCKSICMIGWFVLILVLTFPCVLQFEDCYYFLAVPLDESEARALYSAYGYFTFVACSTYVFIILTKTDEACCCCGVARIIWALVHLALGITALVLIYPVKKRFSDLRDPTTTALMLTRSGLAGNSFPPWYLALHKDRGCGHHLLYLYKYCVDRIFWYTAVALCAGFLPFVMYSLQYRKIKKKEAAGAVAPAPLPSLSDSQQIGPRNEDPPPYDRQPPKGSTAPSSPPGDKSVAGNTSAARAPVSGNNNNSNGGVPPSAGTTGQNKGGDPNMNVSPKPGQGPGKTATAPQQKQNPGIPNPQQQRAGTSKAAITPIQQKQPNPAKQQNPPNQQQNPQNQQQNPQNQQQQHPSNQQHQSLQQKRQNPSYQQLQQQNPSNQQQQENPSYQQLQQNPPDQQQKSSNQQQKQQNLSNQQQQQQKPRNTTPPPQVQQQVPGNAIPASPLPQQQQQRKAGISISNKPKPQQQQNSSPNKIPQKK